MKDICAKHEKVLESYIRTYETTDDWPQIGKYQNEINVKKVRIEAIRNEQAQFGIKTNAMKSEEKVARSRLNANIIDM